MSTVSAAIVFKITGITFSLLSCADGEGNGDFTFACDMDNRTTGASLFAGALWLDTLQTYPPSLRTEKGTTDGCREDDLKGDRKNTIRRLTYSIPYEVQHSPSLISS